jgi:hypothetical protein
MPTCYARFCFRATSRLRQNGFLSALGSGIPNGAGLLPVLCPRALLALRSKVTIAAAKEGKIEGTACAIDALPVLLDSFSSPAFGSQPFQILVNRQLLLPKSKAVYDDSQLIALSPSASDQSLESSHRICGHKTANNNASCVSHLSPNAKNSATSARISRRSSASMRKTPVLGRLCVETFSIATAR